MNSKCDIYSFTIFSVKEIRIVQILYNVAVTYHTFCYTLIYITYIFIHCTIVECLSIYFNVLFTSVCDM